MEPAAPPSNLNIANALTVLRIVGVPVFGWLLLSEGGDDVGFRLWAFVAFILLMITDRIDGDIARSRGLVTNFGKLADPIADKALTGMAFVGLAIIGVLLVVGHDRAAGARVGHHADALRRQEVRRHAGGPGRHDQDDAAGRRDRRLPPAARDLGQPPG